MEFVVYLGVFFMPDGNAAAQRAKAFCELIRMCGYRPVVIGMGKGQDGEILATREVTDSYTLFRMNYPDDLFSWFRMISSISGIKKVLTSLGLDHIKAVIAMDYFSFALVQLEHFCRRNKLKLIVDTVDWFEKSDRTSIRSIIKNIDTDIRMKYLYKKMDNMIAISRYLYGYYEKTVPNIVLIPGIVESKKQLHRAGFEPADTIRMAFVGSPGKKCEKEKIDWLINILCRKRQEGHMNCEFIIAGIDKETLKANRPDLTGMTGFDDCVRCLGKIGHGECLDILRKSDFSVIIRADNLLSRAGFPTKLGESYSCGTPVFVTPTSNIEEYIPEGYGIIASGCDTAAVEEAFGKILSMSADEREKMHEKVSEDNVLASKYYFGQMEEILGSEK